MVDAPELVETVERLRREIAERRRIEKMLRARERTLRKSEERYRGLFESSHDALMLLEPPDWRFTSANPAMVEMFRARSAEDFLSRTPWDLSPPRQHDGRISGDKAREMIETAVRKGTHFFEWTHRRLDGQDFPATVFLNRVGKGRKRLLQATITDITDRKRSEEELVESESRFRKIFEGGPLGMATVGPDFRFTKVNEAFCRFLGYSEAELKERTFLQVTHPDHTGGDAAAIARLARGEVAAYRTEKRYVRKNGEFIWGAAAISTLRDRDGRLVSFLAFVEDITESRAAQEKIAAQKERLAVTLRSIGDGVITTDVQGRIELLNGVAETLTGWRQEDAAGRPLGEVFRIINERTREPCEDPVTRVLATGQVVGLANHTVLVSRDGPERALADSGAPIRDAEGRIVGVVLVFRDVTDRQRMEEELQRSQKLESLGILAGGIAHDFNNLLTAILGNVSLARLDAVSDSPMAGWLDSASSAAGRAQNLAQQLLTFARGGAPVRRTTGIGPLIQDATGFSLRGPNVRCEFAIAEDLWPVDVDVGQISQVISNLVVNADDAMPDGGTIRVFARNVPPDGELPAALPKGRYVEIVVADQGPGIPQEYLSCIFDPYFSTKRKGAGLGLTTCYSIAQKHGGTVIAESRPGAGASFHLYLPASAQEPVMPVVDGAIPHGHGRILVMDDEAMIREVCGHMLVRLGYEVESAQDGAEAIERYVAARAEGRPFDAVILDLTVPGGMGGREAVGRILEIDPRARLIVSSGYSNDPVTDDYRAYGFCAVMVKPYRVGDLGRALQDALGR
jgi:PAS domain S-box-containing protein